jgi:hypothetical protein
VHDLTFHDMKPAPSSADRMMDAAALLMVLGGISLFAFARQALTGIGAGTRDMPSGISAVAVTDFHVAQSRMGLFIVAVGVLVGVAAALRHRLRK